MKQLVQNLKTGDLSLKDVPYPLCKPKGLVVKTICSIISVGTEKSIIELSRKSLLGKAQARPDLFRRAVEKGRKEGFCKVFNESLNRLDEPFPLGYSASGVVVEVGEGVREFKVGDRVAIAGSGYANHAEYNFVPYNLCLHVPQRDNGQVVEHEEAAFCMVGGIAMQGIREAKLAFGEKVAVIGLGLLGLLTIQILQAVCCEVICVDIDEKKCELAKELGCKTTYADPQSLIDEHRNTVDAVLITAATRDSSPLNTAQKITRQKAKIVLVGVCDIKLERKYFWDKELEFKVSKAAGPGILDENYKAEGIGYPVGYIRWPEKKNMEYFLHLVAQDKIDAKKLITHRFEISEAVSAYNMLLAGKEPYVSVILQYPKEYLPKDQELRELKVIKKQLLTNQDLNRNRRNNVGLIGGGLFTKNVFLPALAKLKDIELVGIATTRGITSDHIASKFGFDYATSEYKELLSDQDIGSIFITTRHDLHSEMIIEALRAKKHVFVEKPLCLNRQQLKEIVAAYNDTNLTLMVGFNRRYSPHALDIKHFFGDMKTPYVINCRINAGFIDDSHWTHDSQIGGGRIIGEVCHFVDFLQYITGSRPVRVYAEGIKSTQKHKTDDNIITVVSLENGSVGTITYTSQGSKSYPREIIEMFQNESVYYLEDFRHAIKVKDGKRKKMSLGSQNMGYENELKQFLSGSFSSAQTRDCFINALTVFTMQDSLHKDETLFVDAAI